MFALPPTNISCSYRAYHCLHAPASSGLFNNFSTRLSLPIFTVFEAMSQATVEKVESGKVGRISNKKFPKSVYFILSNVFFDRFSSGGILGEKIGDKLLKALWVRKFKSDFGDSKVESFKKFLLLESKLGWIYVKAYRQSMQLIRIKI